MGITPPLTPRHIHRIIIDEELPGRRQQVSPAIADRILRYGAIVGCRIEHHPRLARGMDRARQLIRKCEEQDRSFMSGTVILADQLTHGRGRFERKWHAPPGGVWLTLVLANTLLPESSRLYPLAAGVATCELLVGYGLPARVKWVNDVLVNGRKIAGILAETVHGARSGEEYVLIGIGLNANNDRFPDELRDTAISMKDRLKNTVDITSLAARLLGKLAWNIGLLHHAEAERLHAPEEGDGPGRDHPLLVRWQELTDMVGRRVLFGHDLRQKPLFEARVLGIDHQGGLLLELDQGHRITEFSGEILYLD
ncbi:MAG: biotin--[acetyl-CoA-carboxylase] ligase [Desulfobacterales bacterium]|nr:biotin--[acetyl-CoA-carboxylase] ligase [Desulfobacterales bacterium]